MKKFTEICNSARALHTDVKDLNDRIAKSYDLFNHLYQFHINNSKKSK